jgi:hypothetical protein
VHLAGADGERHAAEDLGFVDRDVEIPDLEQGGLEQGDLEGGRGAHITSVIPLSR